MLFSHISDTHLGLSQYNIEERENDIYETFNQAIEISIKDHVDFVIFAGDIFHTPNPSGTAIMHMAHALKRLKQNNIESFFILGEHDISRIRSYPVPYVYHKLEYAKYIGQGEPCYYNDVLLVGLDKIRKSEIVEFEDKFQELDRLAKNHQGKKIIVMHQGLIEINKFAGELSVTDLPKNFSYYAMGHLHDKFLKKYDSLEGPVAYPGSIDLTTNEGIKDVKKGFFEVDISSKDAKPQWIELKRRPQLSESIDYNNLNESINELLEKIKKMSQKPIVELKIHGNNINSSYIQDQIIRLMQHTLHCTYKISRQIDNSSVLLEKPKKIEDEMFSLTKKVLNSENLAHLAIKELLPLFSSNSNQANGVIIEKFKQYKKVNSND